MTTTVSDILRKNVFTIEESASIQDSAKKMEYKKVSPLLVVDKNGKPKGLYQEFSYERSEK